MNDYKTQGGFKSFLIDLLSLHPSIIYTAHPLEGRGGAGVDPSWHWARGGQVSFFIFYGND